MTLRHYPVLLGLLFSSCVATPKSEQTINVDSTKTPLRLSFHPPPGWSGPGKGVWPSYESWGFSRGAEPDDRYISVRVDKVPTDLSVRQDSNVLSDADVEKSLKDIFENPIVTTVCFIPIHERKVRFRRAMNVSGAQIFGQTTVDGYSVSMELFSNSGELRREDEKAFFGFVRSLRISKQNE